MRTDEIEEKDKQRNDIIGRMKRGKTLFGFVASLELLVAGIDAVINRRKM